MREEAAIVERPPAKTECSGDTSLVEDMDDRLSISYMITADQGQVMMVYFMRDGQTAAFRLKNGGIEHVSSSPPLIWRSKSSDGRLEGTRRNLMS